MFLFFSPADLGGNHQSILPTSASRYRVPPFLLLQTLASPTAFCGRVPFHHRKTAPSPRRASPPAPKQHRPRAQLRHLPIPRKQVSLKEASPAPGITSTGCGLHPAAEAEQGPCRCILCHRAQGADLQCYPGETALTKEPRGG